MKNIKKVLKALFVLSLLLVSIRNVTYANVPDPISINLKIYAGDIVLFNGHKTVTACAESPADDAPITVNGKCAIEQSELLNTWTWNYAPSGWLDELGGYTTTPDYSKSWNWFNNLNYGNVALNQHILSSDEELLLTYNSYPLQILASKTSGIIGDTITFTAEEKSTFDANYNMLWTPSLEATVTLGFQSCTTIADGTCSIVLDTAGLLNAIGNKTLYVPSANLSIEISTPPPPPVEVITSSGGGGGGGPPPTPSIIKIKFDLEKAYQFIISQQKENGSFGEDLYTDWIAISLASLQNENQKIKVIINLVKYLSEIKTNDYQLTDYERHTMALMALGLNPYNINGENYIKKITDSFDGTQYGNIEKDSDDIFALIVLQNAGYEKEEDIIKNTITYILSKQKENGSWNESVDMTGASMQALSFFNQDEQVKNALIKAKEFLKQNQKEDGGWDNVSSTSWAMGGILALSEKPEDWIKNGNTPLDYLALNQDVDGGIKNEYSQSKLWETAYAITALSGKTWNQIMQKFEKIEEEIIIKEENKIEKKLQEILILLKNKKIEKEIKIIKVVNIKNNVKKTLKNIEIKEKVENLKKENTATVINAIEDSPIQKTTKKEKNWFQKFLEEVFGVN